MIKIPKIQYKTTPFADREVLAMMSLRNWWNREYDDTFGADRKKTENDLRSLMVTTMLMPNEVRASMPGDFMRILQEAKNSIGQRIVVDNERYGQFYESNDCMATIYRNGTEIQAGFEEAFSEKKWKKAKCGECEKRRSSNALYIQTSDYIRSRPRLVARVRTRPFDDAMRTRVLESMIAFERGWLFSKPDEVSVFSLAKDPRTKGRGEINDTIRRACEAIRGEVNLAMLGPCSACNHVISSVRRKPTKIQYVHKEKWTEWFVGFSKMPEQPRVELVEWLEACNGFLSGIEKTEVPCVAVMIRFIESVNGLQIRQAKIDRRIKRIRRAFVKDEKVWRMSRYELVDAITPLDEEPEVTDQGGPQSTNENQSGAKN